MMRAAWPFAFALVATTAARVDAQDCGAEDPPWFCCDEGDSTCIVATKAPKDRPNPDGPVSITLGYGVRMTASTPDARLAIPHHATHWSLGFGYEPPFLRCSKVALALEGEYSLTGASTPELFGGAGSSAATIHALAFVPTLRKVFSSDDPVFAFSFRPAIGVGWGLLELRDTVSATDYKGIESTGFIRLAGSITLRVAGLSAEFGRLETFNTLELDQPRSIESIPLDLSGYYLRLSLSIRFP